MFDFDLEDKICIITGASEGTGEAIARMFLECGAQVVMVSRIETKLKQTLARMNNQKNAILIPADVTSSDQVNRLIEEVLNRFGRIDLLVNNVGKGLKKPLIETSDDDWQFLVQVNMTTTFLCCRAVIPQMRKQKSGVIINIASKSGKVGEADFPAYCAVKHGVVGLTRALAESEKEFGIRVNAICPGPIATDRMITMNPQLDHSAWATPEDIAEMVVFTASSANRVMQGKTLDLF